MFSVWRSSDKNTHQWEGGKWKDSGRATEEEKGQREVREKGAKVFICVKMLGVVLYLWLRPGCLIVQWSLEGWDGEGEWWMESGWWGHLVNTYMQADIQYTHTYTKTTTTEISTQVGNNTSSTDPKEKKKQTRQINITYQNIHNSRHKSRNGLLLMKHDALHNTHSLNQLVGQPDHSSGRTLFTDHWNMHVCRV